MNHNLSKTINGIFPPLVNINFCILKEGWDNQLYMLYCIYNKANHAYVDLRKLITSFTKYLLVGDNFL